MRRPLPELVAVSLLVLALVSPRPVSAPSQPNVRPTETPQYASSRVDWQAIGAEAERLQLERFYATAAARPVVVEPPKKPRNEGTEGNTGAQREQAQAAPESYDGDRFDRLASCESGDGHGSINPQAVSPGGKYRGAFQFSLTSWHSAGMDGDPIDYDYPTQKQTAMYWASITRPSSQWPVCWPRSA